MRQSRLLGASTLLAVLVATEGAVATVLPLFDAPVSSSRAPASPGSSGRAVITARRAIGHVDVLVSEDGTPRIAAGQRIRLNLSDDADFVMTVMDVSRHLGAGQTWTGTLDGIDHGYAVIAVHDGPLCQGSCRLG